MSKKPFKMDHKWGEVRVCWIKWWGGGFRIILLQHNIEILVYWKCLVKNWSPNLPYRLQTAAFPKKTFALVSFKIFSFQSTYLRKGFMLVRCPSFIKKLRNTVCHHPVDRSEGKTVKINTITFRSYITVNDPDDFHP